MYETIQVVETASHNEIILNRPEKRNALSPQMVKELHAALTALTAKAPKLLLLRGAGTSFSSGHDLETSISLADPTQLKKQLVQLQDITQMIVAFPAPVIAAVHGYALGAGCEIALNCDLIFAADDAVFGFPEMEVGLSITQGSSYFLPRMVGASKAKELIFFSERITAQKALELSIINAIYSRGTLFEKVQEKIVTLNKTRIEALAHVKKLFHYGQENSLEKSMNKEIDTIFTLLR